MPRPKPKPTLNRRQAWQEFQHVEKLFKWAAANRAAQNPVTHPKGDPELFKNLDELVTLAFGARVRIERICKKLWDVKPEDLEVYK